LDHFHADVKLNVFDTAKIQCFSLEDFTVHQDIVPCVKDARI